MCLEDLASWSTGDAMSELSLVANLMHRTTDWGPSQLVALMTGMT